MVAQKCRPSFCRLRISGGLPLPVQHGSLRDIKAKHLQFAMDARCAPGRVLGDHAEDEFAQFSAHISSTRGDTMSRDPFPVQHESGAMPSNDCVWLHKNQRALPFGPEATQCCPEQPVRGGEARPRRLARKMASCCRKARFSKSRSRREQRDRAASTNRSLRKRSIQPV